MATKEQEDTAGHEGSNPRDPEVIVYAGFKLRAVAVIIDHLIVFVPIFLIYDFFKSDILLMTIYFLVLAFTHVAYKTYFNYRFGATLGKMLMSIRVTLEQGKKLTVKHALQRSSVDIVGAILSALATLISLQAIEPLQYFSLDALERMELIVQYHPSWAKYSMLILKIWFYASILVLIFNKRKRTLHDYLANTVVVNKEDAEIYKLQTS